MALINSDEFGKTQGGNSADELESYTAVINGIETTLRLTKRDAQARGLIEGGEELEEPGDTGPVELKPYTVEENGISTVLNLSDDDARRRGLLDEKKPAAKAKTPANKQAPSPQNKGGAAGAQKS